MDMTQLTMETVTALGPALPYLLKISDKVADEAVKKLGKDAWDCALSIWHRLRSNIEAKPSAKDAAKDAAENPGDSDAVASFRRQIAKLVSEDRTLAEDLAKLLNVAGQTNVNIVASGTGAVAIGRDARGATIVTGSHNTAGGNQPH